MIMPGIGTAIGAGVGAVIGKTKSTNSKRKHEENNKTELEKIKAEQLRKRKLEQAPSDLKPICYETVDLMVFPGSEEILGLHLKQLESNVFVSDVSPGSPVDIAGVRKGDVLVCVNNSDVSKLNLAELGSLLNKFFQNCKLENSVLDLKIRRIK